MGAADGVVVEDGTVDEVDAGELGGDSPPSRRGNCARASSPLAPKNVATASAIIRAQRRRGVWASDIQNTFDATTRVSFQGNAGGIHSLAHRSDGESLAGR